jgi:hypothetical protein
MSNTSLKPPAIVRISPQDNGRAFYTRFNHVTEDYEQIPAKVAIALMQEPAIPGSGGCIVEVAVNHPNDRHSHIESRGGMKVI